MAEMTTGAEPEDVQPRAARPPARAEFPVAPRDVHNERLVHRVAPADWENPEPEGRYDLAVLGAGTAGLVAAAGAAGLGARVALVERSLLGGDCLVHGCVPSKALLAAAHAAAAVRGAGAYGVDLPGEPAVDFPAVMERMRRLRAEIAVHDAAARFRDLGIDVYFGDGRFADAGSLEVDGRRLGFRRAVIATGARPVQPPIEGLDEAGFLTSETIFSLTRRPERFAVVGAGPIGCEMAQAFARFGSRITLIEETDRILVNDDPEAAAVVADALRADGVEIAFGHGLERVEGNDDDFRLRLSGDGGERTLEVDRLLVAVGRAPNVQGIGLEAAGVAFDARSGIETDARLRTTNPSIYAAGDVAGGLQFTHVSDAQARVVIRNALFPGHVDWDPDTVPWCTYTDPELAHVGLTPQSAAERGVEIDVYTQPLETVDRALLEGEPKGFARVYAKRGKGRIVGATLVGAGAGERISEITLAMKSGAGLGDLAGVIHPYPTRAEAWKKIADEYQRRRLTPTVKWLMEKWFALLR